jgi:hemerythrin
MTVQFRWDDKYCIDGGAIDEQHRRLFDLATGVYQAMEPPASAEAIKQAVKNLYRYMEEHFRKEEGLMKKVAYAGYDQHVASHKRIITRMNLLLTHCSSLADLGARLEHLMVDWATRHIMHEDKQIAAAANRPEALAAT